MSSFALVSVVACVAHIRPSYESSFDRLDLTHGELRNWLEDGSVYELATYANGTTLASTLPSD